MSEKQKQPDAIPPAIEFPDHNAIADAVRETGIVTVDDRNRGHTLPGHRDDGTKSFGGDFLSYNEMDQIYANKDLILNNMPTPPEVPGPKQTRRMPKGFGIAFKRALTSVPAEHPDDPYDNPDFQEAQSRANQPDIKGPDGAKDHMESPIDISKVPALNPKPADVHPRTTSKTTPPLTAIQRIRAEQAKPKKTDSAWTKRKKAADMEDAELAERQPRGGQNPIAKDKIEVLEEVPWLQSRLLRSKYLSWLASDHYQNNSFTLLEYHAGIASPNHSTRVRGHVLGRGTVAGIRDAGDRRSKRFVVKEEKEGIIVPHVFRTIDRGRGRLPDARVTSRPERKRREALIKSVDGGSWAGGLHSQGREVIAVGEDRGLGIIGFDSRPIARASWLGRRAEGFANMFGFDRRRTPNGEAEAYDRGVAGNAGRQADVHNKIRARVRGPVAPPHPHDRRTPRWQGWGAPGYRFMDDGPLPENDRNRLVRPHRYRGF